MISTREEWGAEANKVVLMVLFNLVGRNTYRVTPGHCAFPVFSGRGKAHWPPLNVGLASWDLVRGRCDFVQHLRLNLKRPCSFVFWGHCAMNELRIKRLHGAEAQESQPLQPRPQNLKTGPLKKWPDQLLTAATSSQARPAAEPPCILELQEI